MLRGSSTRHSCSSAHSLLLANQPASSRSSSILLQLGHLTCCTLSTMPLMPAVTACICLVTASSLLPTTSTNEGGASTSLPGQSRKGLCAGHSQGRGEGHLAARKVSKCRAASIKAVRACTSSLTRQASHPPEACRQRPRSRAARQHLWQQAGQALQRGHRALAGGVHRVVQLLQRWLELHPADAMAPWF